MGSGMSEKKIRVKVLRLDPELNEEPRYHSYEVPLEEGMSAMDALDYIYHNLDGTLAYYDHAGCSLGICGQCTARIGGKPGLLCQTIVNGDITLDPASRSKVIKDLVIKRKKNPITKVVA